MEMRPEIIAITGLGVLLALWYGAGYLYNRRRGRRLFCWLEAGLETLGDEREAGWIGSPASGARINIVHANPPFRRLELTLLLENREIPLLWLIDRLRGKQDWLIMKATLRSPRRGELRAVSGRRRAAQHSEQSWKQQDGPHGLAVEYRGRGAQQQVVALEPWLQTYGPHVHRLLWQKHDPHIQLQVGVNQLLTTSSKIFLADLQDALGMKDIQN
jgi:hypothetical protein